MRRGRAQARGVRGAACGARSQASDRDSRGCVYVKSGVQKIASARPGSLPAGIGGPQRHKPAWWLLPRGYLPAPQARPAQAGRRGRPGARPAHRGEGGAAREAKAQPRGLLKRTGRRPREGPARLANPGRAAMVSAAAARESRPPHLGTRMPPAAAKAGGGGRPRARPPRAAAAVTGAGKTARAAASRRRPGPAAKLPQAAPRADSRWDGVICRKGKGMASARQDRRRNAVYGPKKGP
ncbi:MAG: hypothetical protein J3K34DRAFT_117781 [Monoraphidium minutum]|nr:MAG: hypothetical protein J3K34DRAFT_117781 [Monoraphidium minutum]